MSIENPLMSEELVKFVESDDYKEWQKYLMATSMCGLINLKTNKAEIVHVDEVNGDKVTVTVTLTDPLCDIVGKSSIESRKYKVSKKIDGKSNLILFYLPNKKTIHDWPEQLRLPLLYSFGNMMVGWGYIPTRITQ